MIATQLDASEPAMAFREQRAWIGLVSLLAYVPYFALAPAAAEGDVRGLLVRLGWFAACSLARALLFFAPLLWLVRRTPRIDRASPDERDRAIDRRAASAAYYLLMAEMVVVGIMMPFGKSGWEIVDAALLSIILSEGLREVVIVRSYRRGWHG